MAEILSSNREATDRVLEEAEKAARMRCDGCGRRIYNGFRFYRFLERFDPERTAMVVTRHVAVACVREDCSAADEAKVTAHACEPVQYVWLDEVRAERVAGSPFQPFETENDGDAG